MSCVISPGRFYHVGGAMHTDTPSYVERQADQELHEHLLAGDFCYVLTPRQMGKSSLVARTVAHLQRQRVRSVVLDLQGKTARGMAAEAFYAGLLDACIRQLKLPIALPQWWQEHALLSAGQRFTNFIADEVLSRVRQRLVVFVDEIDVTLKLAFADDFFATIRAFYSDRAWSSTFQRLTFVLLGVASPSELMQDRTRSPFNIGQRIELTDFTLEEARTFADGLPVDSATATQLLTEVMAWTGGHPYLTHKVCAALAADTQVHEGRRSVETLIAALFFSDATWSDSNLAQVRDRMVEDKKRARALLALYRRILSGERLLDDERSPVHTALKLAGIVKVFPGGVLRPRNRIYEQVFHLAWLDTVHNGQGRQRPATTTLRPEPVAIGPLPQNPADALSRYCQMLVADARHAALRGLDIATSDPTGNPQHFDLAQAYVELLTTTQVPRDQGKKRRQRQESAVAHETRPLSALEAVVGQRHIVLLGDPGSGKSTFLTYLALCLAAQHLEPQQQWLQRLKEWPAQAADVVPIPVTLRDVAHWLPPRTRQAKPDHLWNYIVAWLEAQHLAFMVEPLHDRLAHGQAMLLLDGLDEIPTAQQRTVIRNMVTAFAQRYAPNRIVVTCRTLSYQDPAWQLAGFAQATLAPFEAEQIDRFIAAWYAELARLGSIKPGAVEGVTRQLQTAVRRPDLWRLAANPLLLTVMALVQTHKGHLPEARALLYEETVDMLLWRWEYIKTSGEDSLPRLRSLLTQADRTDVDLKRALWRLAFEVHQHGGTTDAETVADIGESHLASTLVALHPDRSATWAREVIEVMKLRAGLLLERAPAVYTFPHRTFQEYLAGAHLSTLPDFPQQAAQLAAAGAFWREVILLAAGRLVYLHGDTSKPLALVAELCPATSVDTKAGWRQTWLAGDVLLEVGRNRVSDSALGRELAERVRQRLVVLVRTGRLSVRERAAAGNTLARLGDPRFRPDAWYLPDEPLLGFVEIPAGPFLMGSNKRHDALADNDETPQHTLTLPRYYMARYPVTVAQWRAFVEASGHTPTDADSLHGLSNHPVVYVTWHEALAYCHWLTERLRAWSGTPEPLATLLRQEGERVILPSEAEWEKAARGPDGRRYPWGADPDPERANYIDTGILDTTPVGCFPQGVSPYGLEDMSGNVWEWTRSLWGKDVDTPTFAYPYNPEDGREQLQAPDTMRRVLRGGAFWGGHQDVRCAFRLRNGTPYAYDGVGFRVVLAARP